MLWGRGGWGPRPPLDNNNIKSKPLDSSHSSSALLARPAPLLVAMPVSDAEAISAAASAALATVKRGLGERGSLDVKTEEVHLLMVLQLARSSDIDEGL